VQTLVIIASGSGAPTTVRHDVDEGIRRVEAHYESLWATPPKRSEAVSTTTGMVLWESQASPCVWPAWVRRPDDVVASLYAPLGYERIVGSVGLESAPFILAHELRRRPHRMTEVAAPFVCARLASTGDTLDLFTDAVGVGRLFEARTGSGWVWSNRPLAALLFAGLPARADPDAWEQSAVADEFFGHSMPYRDVRALDPATHIHWDGPARARRLSTVDTGASWVPAGSFDHSIESLLDAAAADLTGVASSVGRLYRDTPVVDLSGGRDSRLVAAAFLASGSDVVLHSHDAVPGDLEVASQLTALVGRPVEHLIQHVPSGGEMAPPRITAADTARRWHDYAEGLRPCTYLSSSVPAHLDSIPTLVVGGAGGEVAHGFFYPPDLDRLEHLPVDEQLEEFAARILSRQASVPGATVDARAQVSARILELLRRISSWGVRGGNVLDHYYVLQRMRRWGTTGERLGTVSPLLASSFLSAALALSPHERRSSTLHRELTRRLLPAWADVPYFPGETPARITAHQPHAPRVIRLGDAEDRIEVESILADTADWGAAFDTQEVHRLWRLSVGGETDVRQERVLRSALWRAGFTDHLASLGGGALRQRPTASIALAAEPGSRAGGREAPSPLRATIRRHGRRVLAHPQTKALARTRLWRATRGTRLGVAVRALAERVR
jgi:hypothetical protein